MPGMLKDIIDSIFSPTTKPQAGVVRAMNYSFYALFVTLLGLAYASSWNPHVFALTGVAVALYFSISWFVAELGKIDDQQKKSGESGTPSSNNDEKRSTPVVPTPPGKESYAEVAAEPPSQGTASSAIVNGRSGLSSRKGASQGPSSSSFASVAYKNGTASGAKPGQESYAEAAAEEPDPTESVVREDKLGRTEIKE